MYRADDHFVAVGSGYKDKIVSKVPELHERVSVLPNGVDGDLYRPLSPDETLLKEVGFEGKFVCSYVGTIGMAHGLEVVVRAAKRLQQSNRKDIAFLIVGDGATREALQQQVADEKVGQYVVFTGRLPKEKIPRVLASSGCCLIHLKGKKLFETVIPSKIFETMAMQRPIIMGVRGPSREIVMEAGAGVPMTPDSDEELAVILTQLADDRESAAAMGLEARQFVLDNYNREDLAAAYLGLLHRVAGLVPRQADTDGSGEIDGVVRPIIWRQNSEQVQPPV